MAEPKTKPSELSVDDFISNLTDQDTRRDCRELKMLFEQITGEAAKMWGSSIIGFGEYSYTYESGRSGTSMLTGFSPRKINLTLYIMDGFDDYQDLLQNLGKHKTSKSCLYIKQLADIDIKVLKELIRRSVATMRKRYS